jgi:hypothetical protein
VSEITAQRAHGRLFFRAIAKYLGWALVLIAGATLGYDLAVSGGAWPSDFRSTWDWWRDMHNQSLEDFTRFVGNLSKPLWDIAVEPALRWPAFAAPLVLGPLMLMMSRQPRH